MRPTLSRRLSALLAFWLFAADCGAAAPAQGAQAAIRDVAVVDVRTGTVLPHRTVSIANGRIASIAETTGADIAGDGIAIIDGRGRFLVPGFIDMHAHLNNQLESRQRAAMLTLSDADIVSPHHVAVFLYNGVTTLQVMHGDEAILRLRDAIERGQARGPRLIVGSPRLDGNPPSGPYPRIVATRAEGLAVADEMKMTGYDFIKVYDRLSEGAYDAIVTRAHELGLRVDGHLPRTLPLEHALDGMQDHVTHSEDFVAYARNYDAAEATRLATAVKRSGIGVTPNLIVFENVVRSVRNLDEVLADPAAAYADPLVYFSWLAARNPYRAERFQTADMRAALGRQLQFMQQLTLAMYRAGVPLVVGTDCNISGTVAGFSFHDELAGLVRLGIPPAAVLRMATLNGAAALRLDAELGAVEVGKRADLLLLAANPLDDIANSRRIDGVVLRGAWYPQPLLRTLVDDALGSYAPLDRRLRLEIQRPAAASMH